MSLTTSRITSRITSRVSVLYFCALAILSASAHAHAQPASKAAANNPWKPVTDAIVANLEQRLTTYEGITKALQNGKRIRGVFDYKKCEFLYLKEFVDEVTNPNEQTNDPLCKLNSTKKSASCYASEKQGPDAIGGLGFDTWEQFGHDITKNFPDKRAFVAASETKLISIRGFVLNYGSARVYEDNAVLIKVNYLDPKDYSIKMDEQFKCNLSNGTDNNGASFFMAR